MPIAIAILAIGFLIMALRGNQNAVFQTLGEDLTGAVGFFRWVGLLILLGIIGRVTKLEQAFTMLIWLVAVSYLLTRESVFGNFDTAIRNVKAPPPADTAAVGRQSDVSSGATSGTPSTTAGFGQAGAGVSGQGVPGLYQQGEGVVRRASPILSILGVK